MTGAIRCGVTAFVVVVLGFSTGGGAEAQRKQAPSVLLPLETMWTGGLPGAPAWAPVHAEGRLFVALQDGHLVAVRLSDGEVQWTIEQPVVAQPAIGAWRLFVAGPDELMALDTRTGGRFWSIPLEAPLSAPLVWDMQWLIATLEGGTVLALRGQDGEIVWRRTLDASIDVPPAVAGGRVYVSLTDGGLAALSLSDGTSVWQRQLDGAPQEVLPLDDLFVGAGDHNFYRLSHRDGTEQWRWLTGGDIVGVPTVDEKRVFFSSLDNVVWALDRASGVQRWRQPLTARPTAGPSYVGDLLVFGGLSQQISFYEPSDGTLYARVSVPTDLAFPPLHLEGMPGDPTLVFVTGDGRLQALGPSTVPRVLDPGVTPILGTPPAKPNLPDENGMSDAAGPDPGAAAALDAATGLGAAAVPDTTAEPDVIPEVAEPVNESLAVLTPVPALVLSTADEPASDLTEGPAPVGATALAAQPAATQAPNGAEDAPPSRFAGAREYAIQVAAFDTFATAVALADELADADYPAYVVDPQPGDAPQLYRVQIGDFPDRASAETAGVRITDDQALDWQVVTLP